jgi:RNA polymerase sigma factor (TIGR02999 family)
LHQSRIGHPTKTVGDFIENRFIILLSSMGDITELIQRARSGDSVALDSLYEAIYPDLRRIARARLRGSFADPDLGTTALVSEYFLKMQAARRLDAPDRAHFFGYTAKVMRSIIVDIARARTSSRRGGRAEHLAIDDSFEPNADMAAEAQIVRVHESINEIAAVDERLAQLVEMRYFVGFDDEEIAQALDISIRTVRRDWQRARLLLAAALR